ncbi:MAG: nitrilase-related carbon-nitrogen hydrolase [Pseudonocardiaceae bacterium]
MKLTVAATQMASTWDLDENLTTAERVVRLAAAEGANIILLPEMFATPHFSFMDWAPIHFDLAMPVAGNPILAQMSALARELNVVLPVSFFERANNAYYNSLMLIDADGQQLGVYRKSHIPVGPPGCFEKVYTSQGDTGFKVWETRFGAVGAGICWDQWFPEAARIMCLMGADVLLYPTGIGSDCHDHWQIVMQGHAAANLTPLVASNRIGTERGEFGSTTFWGRSFIAGSTGQIIAKSGQDEEEVVTATFDLAAHRSSRANWGVFRDRRPDLYTPLLTLDGRASQGRLTD